MSLILVFVIVFAAGFVIHLAAVGILGDWWDSLVASKVRRAEELAEARIEAEAETAGLTGMQISLFCALARRRNYNTDGLALKILDPEFARRTTVFDA